MDLLTAILTAPGTSLVIAGGLGGVARWLYVILLDKKMAMTQGIATTVLGAILGYYLSPNFVGIASSALAAFSQDPGKLPTFTAFSTGVAGVGVVGLGLDWMSTLRKKLIPETPVDPVPKPGGGT